MTKVDVTRPEIRLFQNPWSETVPDGVVLQQLLTAATRAGQILQNWIDQGAVEEGRGSYACVILDPTCPRWHKTILDRTMAIVLYGPNAAQYIPNAAAKADAEERHCLPNGELIANANYHLGNGDFAWGHSVKFGGGSGLSADQDHGMASWITQDFFLGIHDIRAQWLKERRNLPAGQRWFNQNDQPGDEYLAVAELTNWLSPDLT